MASRQIFKRIYEVRVGDGRNHSYDALRAAFVATYRVQAAKKISKAIIDSVDTIMRERGPTESVAENSARARFHEVMALKQPLVIIDFPTRGVPKRNIVPREIGDSERKYSAQSRILPEEDHSVFLVNKELLQRCATFRVFFVAGASRISRQVLDSDASERVCREWSDDFTLTHLRGG